ncbi:LacI family DNA-binding transcriptional regulator [Aidingimonas halophila]|uniref:Transcriptional regulator, LacI family n=1 Tax=Aidingimonas halophila TaxID=574349 RepID=A0A1H3FRK5_9GAMM|nr:LacI family DNA-binding transcriptional regulator [Aidingimonas halophila]GHC38371.1 LacI family transcriptional regulator [Aidingimonas halophila]SDX93571.1 transcriptional regulator, LacI family [Aidingimonas halophila]
MAHDDTSSQRDNSSVTLQDIAAHAGVSRSTVSLVLRESPLVAEHTRDKVRQSIKALGYVYNRGAAALRSSRTSTLGVVVYDIANPFFGAMVAGIDAALNREGYVSFLANSEDSCERQRRFLERMREHRVDGILLCPAEATDPGLIDTLADWRMPCIQVLRHVGHPPFDYAGTDFHLGVCQAMNHLVALGHERIAFLGGHAEHSATRERWHGYRESLSRHGLTYQRLLRATVTRRDGFDLIQRLMSETPPPSAVVCHNDLVAFGAILGLKRLGLEPGVDCAVIGTDDVEEAELGDPALTSVATHPYAIGEEAARLALRRIANPDGAREQVVLSPRLRVRQSCGAQPRQAAFPETPTPDRQQYTPA